MRWLFLLGFIFLTNFSFSVASDIICCTEKSLEQYHKRGDKWYGYKGAPCTDSSECFSTAYERKWGTCQEVESVSFLNAKCSKKYSSSVCWIPGINENRQFAVQVFQDLLGSAAYICRVRLGDVTVQGKLIHSLIHSNNCKYIWNGEIFASSRYEFLADSGTQRWKSHGYTMDKAVMGGFAENGKPTLICRASFDKDFPGIHGKFGGRLSPPNYDVCEIFLFDTIYERSNFEILVNE